MVRFEGSKIDVFFPGPPRYARLMFPNLLASGGTNQHGMAGLGAADFGILGCKLTSGHDDAFDCMKCFGASKNDVPRDGVWRYARFGFRSFSLSGGHSA